jgi:predicted branched-subunit amino acid permease
MLVKASWAVTATPAEQGQPQTKGWYRGAQLSNQQTWVASDLSLLDQGVIISISSKEHS